MTDAANSEGRADADVRRHRKPVHDARRAPRSGRASTSSSPACGAGDRSWRRSRSGGIPLSDTRSRRSAACRRSRSRRGSRATSPAAASQIVHAYNFYGNVFAIPPARLAAPVVIASIRDCAPYLTPMQKRVQRYACQLADCVLVNADGGQGLAGGRRLRRVEDRRHPQRRRPDRGSTGPADPGAHPARARACAGHARSSRWSRG